MKGDYIDRQKLLKDIEKYHLSDGKFQHWVEVQPPVDVVKVVRCKDCQQFEPSEKWGHNAFCYAWGISTDSDSYCSYGVRKDETD